MLRGTRMLQSGLLVMALVAFASLNVRPAIGTAPTQLSACGTLNTSGVTYLLTASLSSGGSCISITANGITLSCNGHSIIGSGPGSGIGIELSGTTRVKVSNCNVS